MAFLVTIWRLVDTLLYDIGQFRWEWRVRCQTSKPRLTCPPSQNMDTDVVCFGLQTPSLSAGNTVSKCHGITAILTHDTPQQAEKLLHPYNVWCSPCCLPRAKPSRALSLLPPHHPPKHRTRIRDGSTPDMGTTITVQPSPMHTRYFLRHA